MNPLHANDSTPRKRKVNEKSCPNKTPEENVCNALEEVMCQNPTFLEISAKDNVLDKALVPEQTMTQVPDNSELLIFHIYSGEMWERKKLVIDDIFSYAVAIEISKGNDETDDTEPRTINECRQRNYQPKWKEAIQVQLNSLEKHGVFGPIVRIPKI